MIILTKIKQGRLQQMFDLSSFIPFREPSTFILIYSKSNQMEINTSWKKQPVPNHDPCPLSNFESQ